MRLKSSGEGYRAANPEAAVLMGSYLSMRVESGAFRYGFDDE